VPARTLTASNKLHMHPLVHVLFKVQDGLLLGLALGVGVGVGWEGGMVRVDRVGVLPTGGRNAGQSTCTRNDAGNVCKLDQGAAQPRCLCHPPTVFKAYAGDLKGSGQAGSTLRPTPHKAPPQAQQPPPPSWCTLTTKQAPRPLQHWTWFRRRPRRRPTSMPPVVGGATTAAAVEGMGGSSGGALSLGRR
jgi:hypothetical protein